MLAASVSRTCLRGDIVGEIEEMEEMATNSDNSGNPFADLDRKYAHTLHIGAVHVRFSAV